MLVSEAPRNFLVVGRGAGRVPADLHDLDRRHDRVADLVQERDVDIAVAGLVVEVHHPDAVADVAMETADITLMSGDLRGVVTAIALSRATTRNITQNLFAAFIYNILLIPAAALGMLNPIWAAAAMGLSSVSVVGNALRLRRFRPADAV